MHTVYLYSARAATRRPPPHERHRRFHDRSHAARAAMGLPDRRPYCRSVVELVTGAEVYPDRVELMDRHLGPRPTAKSSTTGRTARPGGSAAS